MEPEGSILHLQVPTFPYPDPDQSSPCPIPLPEDLSSYYPPIYAWVLQVFSFPQISPLKPCIHFPPTCYMPFPSNSSRFGHPNYI